MIHKSINITGTEFLILSLIALFSAGGCVKEGQNTVGNNDETTSEKPIISMVDPIDFSTNFFFGGPYNNESDLIELDYPFGNWVCGGAYKYARQNPDGTWVCGGEHAYAHQNPDGTWVCGGKHKYAHQNPDGTWVCGGEHAYAHQNPDGTWVCGGKHKYAHQNPDGTWVCGGEHAYAHQNPDGTWVCGGKHKYAHQNPAQGFGLCYSIIKDTNEDHKYSFYILDGKEKESWIFPQNWVTDNKYSFTLKYDSIQKNYIIIDGLFKGAQIVGYEQNGKTVTSSFTKGAPITGFTVYYKLHCIRLSESGEPIPDTEYNDGVSNGVDTGEASGENSGVDGGVNS